MKSILDIEAAILSATSDVVHFEKMYNKSDGFKNDLKAAKNQYSFLVEVKQILVSFPPDYIVVQIGVVMKRYTAYEDACKSVKMQFVREKLKEELGRINTAYNPQSLKHQLRILDYILEIN